MNIRAAGLLPKKSLLVEGFRKSFNAFTAGVISGHSKRFCVHGRRSVGVGQVKSMLSYSLVLFFVELSGDRNELLY